MEIRIRKFWTPIFESTVNFSLGLQQELSYSYIRAEAKFRISAIFQRHLWTPHIQLSEYLPYIPMNIGPISQLILPLLFLCSKEMARIFTTNLTFCLLL